MRNQLEEIRTWKGKTNGNILLIAPHGHRDDDENTGALTREIQKRLDCHAIINEVYRKPKQLEPGKFEDPNVENKILDLNNHSQAKLHKNYIRKIKKLITAPENTFVFWIHGIADQNLAAEANRLQADGANRDTRTNRSRRSSRTSTSSKPNPPDEHGNLLVDSSLKPTLLDHQHADFTVTNIKSIDLKLMYWSNGG